MARIPEAELERLKREVSLARLIEAQGLKLTSQGKDLACHCPWHEGDDTPSCIISPKTNLWHCFGCDAGGSVIDWVMRTHKVSFRHACELLAKQHPALAASATADASSGQQKISQGKLRAAQSFSLAAGDQALLDQVIEFYHATLKTSPEALSYLDSRGLGSRELIERFRLGYANRTLAYRLAPKAFKAGAELRSALQRVGILRESGHEHLNGSIVVPLFGGSAEAAARPVVGAYARKLRDDLRPGTPKHLYLPGPHRGVFNREGIEGQAEVILCEALLDALTFWAAGYRNVTSCYGVHGFTEEILVALKACGAERILIAFDRDEAGDRAAETLAKRLLGEGLDCFRLQFPKGEDANSYARLVTPAEKSLGVVIRSAQWLGSGAKPVLTTSAGTLAIPTTARAATEPVSLAAEAIALPDAPLPEPAAAALPPRPDPEPPAQSDEQQLVIAYGERRYRVRGLPKQLGEALKVNVLVTRATDGGLTVADAVLHVDTLDLYQAKQRQVFAKLAALELSVEESVIQHDLGRLLLQLEQVIDARAKAAEQPGLAPPAAMTEQETAAALAFLRDPKLIERIIGDFERVGLVGEPSNALVAYLACISRKLASPLAVLIQSTSAAGKSTLMDTVLALVPEEDRVHYSAMTGQSLFYLGEQEIKHKILAIAEEEGVRQAAYALKVLQSQGQLTIASTGKDPATGMLVTQQYRVEGPVMLFLTTTAIDVDEELVNRCLVLTINESREQTRAIQARQRSRRTLAGLIAQSEAEAITTLHQHAQRLLRPLAVVNPYAEQLTFLDDRTRTRRDHAKYLTLIESIALLHQQQREIRTLQRRGQTIEYLEVSLADVALANELAHEVLGRSLDELPPQTRRVLGMIEELVERQAKERVLSRSDVRFTRRELRAACGMSDAAIRVHLERLIAMEYLRPSAGRNGLRFEYELLFDGDLQSSVPQVIGLIDVEKLATTIATSQGKAPDLAPRLQVARTELAPTSPGHDRDESSEKMAASGDVATDEGENARQRPALDRRSRSASSISSSFLAAKAASPGS
ncbi:MAG: CHC2 zinc finger domain-containing protein [Hyphomicrobium sp.]|uniref:CHC2 zinc finger domain-containing protein n=1 Tax=Hyphomicrobium sp. TaxID=82 RepID=UPI003D0C0688